MLRSFFDRICAPTSIPRRPIGVSGRNDFLVFRFHCNIDFWFHFGSNLASFSLPKSQNIHQKLKSKTRRFFTSILASMFVRCGLHLGAQIGAMLAPSGPQDAPKTHQKSIKSWSTGLIKTAQNASQTLPGPLRTSILVPPNLDVRWMLDRFLDAFGH